MPLESRNIDIVSEFSGIGALEHGLIAGFKEARPNSEEANLDPNFTLSGTV